MATLSALSSSVHQNLKEKGIGLAALLLLVSTPLFVLLPGVSVAFYVLVTISVYWLWRLLRQLFARVATSALASGNERRAKRLYWFLFLTTVSGTSRKACALSLAACAASARRYPLAEVRLGKLTELDGALLAVSLNLRAYCRARQGKSLEDALQLSKSAVQLRRSVLGFRHTRGVVLLELGRLEEASRDLEATWGDGRSTPLFEAERCYDLGRLWSLRGQPDYGNDYYERSRRASPASHWAHLSEETLALSPSSSRDRGVGNTLDEFVD